MDCFERLVEFKGTEIDSPSMLESLLRRSGAFWVEVKYMNPKPVCSRFVINGEEMSSREKKE